MYKNNVLFLLEDVLFKDIMEKCNELDSYYGYEFKDLVTFKYDVLNVFEIIEIDFSINKKKEINHIYIEFNDKINYHFERKNIEFRGFTFDNNDFISLSNNMFYKQLDNDIKMFLDNVLINFEKVIEKENYYNILIKKENI